MIDYFSSDFKLGILGGGQLGKMMLYETRKFDIQTYVLDPNPYAPCKISANYFEQGNLMDFETVLKFGQKVNVLTFEIEAVNVEALEELEKNGIKVFPSSQTLQKIQNKAVQKEYYRSHNLPTSPFKTFATRQNLITAISHKEITFPFVWKSATGGYDGFGVSIIKTEKDVGSIGEGECIAEDLIPFKNELAVIVARNSSGEIKTYPVVEMEFHPTANQVEYVICPARISEEISQKAQNIAKQVSEAFEHVGLLAVEMFLTQSDEILINEVAPRPHNSGHYSIEGSITNQFEQQIRAILNLPLGETASKINAVMVNLVGEEGFTGDVTYKNMKNILKLEGVTPHIYGKRETRPFRKMGHVTIVNEDLSKARQIAEQVKEQIKVISLKK